MSSSSKLCGGCKKLLPVSDFAFKNKATGRLQSKCKGCSRLYAKGHYKANREQYVEKAQVNNAVYRGRNAELVAQHLAKACCTVCSTTHDLTFQGGGVQAGQPVHMALNGALSEKAVQAAIARSTVICRTCLGIHHGKALEPWQKLTSPERVALQAERAAAGIVPVPAAYYKAYRRTDGTICGFEAP